MTRHKEIQSADRAAVEAKLRAADTPARATRIGKAIAAKIPQTWDGQGDPPIGWTRHWGVQEDPETGDALFSASTELLAKIPELADAQREVPERWRAQSEETGKGDEQPGRAGR